jgi:phenylacetic acid degradation operon negative regulatory protein
LPLSSRPRRRAGVPTKPATRRRAPARLPPEQPGPLATAEPPQPQDLVVTLLGSYVHGRHDTVWSGGLVALLEELGFSPGAARVALTRVVNRGLIVRVRQGRLVHYRITPRAERVLGEGDGRIFSLGHPRDDGSCWTFLWHQIPEERRLERSRLGRRLRFLGFGSLQDSVWVSPHDHEAEVVELLDELGVEGYGSVLLAPSASARGLRVIAERAWDLSGLAERYAAFEAEFGGYVPQAERLTDRQRFLVRTRLIQLFRVFPFLDPELPEDLAPLAAERERAVAVFDALWSSLAEGAQRHFDRVISGYRAG